MKTLTQSLRCGLLAACTLLGAVACSAPHIVAPPLPSAFAPGRPAFDGVTLYVHSMRVTDMGQPVPAHVANGLRPSLIGYLKSHTQFTDVRSGTPVDSPPAQQALVVDVDIGFERTSYRTYILDALFVYPGIFILPVPTPHWGTATVKVSGAFVDAMGRPVWNTEASGKNDYSVIFYSWYRTEVYEKAYQTAFAKAFTGFASNLGGQHDAVMAALAPPPRDASKIKVAGASMRAHRTAEAELMSALPAPPPAATAAPEDSSSTYTYTGPRLKVAVMPSQADSATSLPKVFDDYVLTAVQNTGNFETIGQDDIAAMLGLEQQKDALGCDDASCMASIGGALGVDLMVLVKVSRVGDGADADWAISSKLLNARTPRVEARTNEFVHGSGKVLLQQVGPLMRKLFSLRKAPVPAS